MDTTNPDTKSGSVSTTSTTASANITDQTKNTDSVVDVIELRSIKSINNSNNDKGELGGKENEGFISHDEVHSPPFETIQLETKDENIQKSGSIEEQKKDEQVLPSWSYATRKTLTGGMLNATLLLSNASDLKSLFDIDGDDRDGFWTTDLVLLLVSIALQVSLATVLLFLGFAKAKTKPMYEKVCRLNNAATGLVLFITIVNILITGFNLELKDGP